MRSLTGMTPSLTLRAGGFPLCWIDQGLSPDQAVPNEGQRSHSPDVIIGRVPCLPISFLCPKRQPLIDNIINLDGGQRFDVQWSPALFQRPV